MSELFAPSLAEQLVCIDREIAMRQRVYPRWIEQGRMSTDKAAREISTMQAVRNTLEGLIKP